MAQLDPYTLLAGDDALAREQIAAQLAALRGREPMNALFMMSGDKALAPFGQRAQVMDEARTRDLAGMTQHRLELAMRKQAEGRQQSNLERQLKADAARQQAEERRLRLMEERERRTADAESWAPMPDGGILNRRTGEIRHPGQQPGAPGGPGGDTPPNVKLTDQQAKAFGAASRIMTAGPQLAGGPGGGMRGRVDAWATGASGGLLNRIVPQEFASEHGQRYYAAARDVIAALLRKESGAAITRDEWEQLGPLYIPMPFDNEAVRQDKLQRLTQKLEDSIVEAGPTAAPWLRQRQQRALSGLQTAASPLFQQGAKTHQRGGAQPPAANPAAAARADAYINGG